MLVYNSDIILKKPLKIFEDIMLVSIIIPVIAISDYIRETLSHLLQLDYQDIEILILPNIVTDENRSEFQDVRIRLIASYKPSPTYKRNLGAKHARGEILAFLDDDAYPCHNWLNQALKHFNQNEVGAVGGPAVTPSNDPLFAQVSGAVYTSLIGGGICRYRYWPTKKKQEVDDYPSVNLLVSKSIFFEVNGFNIDFWPGEDTKLCLDIVNHGKKIIYDPTVLVWHHRRPSFSKHIKQVASYAIHRGYFMKKFPQTSLRLHYLVPSLFVFWLIIMPFFFFQSIPLISIYVSVLILYAILLLISGIIEARRYSRLSVGLFVIPYIVATHITYGIMLLIGLLTKRLQSVFRV